MHHRYGDMFAAQVAKAGGWLILPEPADDIEREALRLFVDEVESTTDAEVTLSRPA